MWMKILRENEINGIKNLKVREIDQERQVQENKDNEIVRRNRKEKTGDEIDYW